jgi:hypothetical protein
MELMYSMSLCLVGISCSAGLAQKRCGQITKNKIIPRKEPSIPSFVVFSDFCCNAQTLKMPALKP